MPSGHLLFAAALLHWVHGEHIFNPLGLLQTFRHFSFMDACSINLWSHLMYPCC